MIIKCVNILATGSPLRLMLAVALAAFVFSLSPAFAQDEAAEFGEPAPAPAEPAEPAQPDAAAQQPAAGADAAPAASPSASQQSLLAWTIQSLGWGYVI